MESKQSRRAKTILKSNKAGELTQLDFKTDNKATVIKTVCRQLHQWNRTEYQNRPTYTWSIHFQQQKIPFNKLYWNKWISISEKKNLKTPTTQI